MNVYHYCSDQIAGKSSSQNAASNFTTQLSVLVTTDLNGSSVECHEELPETIRLIDQQTIILTPVTGIY